MWRIEKESFNIVIWSSSWERKQWYLGQVLQNMDFVFQYQVVKWTSHKAFQSPFLFGMLTWRCNISRLLMHCTHTRRRTHWHAEFASHTTITRYEYILTYNNQLFIVFSNNNYNNTVPANSNVTTLKMKALWTHIQLILIDSFRKPFFAFTHRHTLQ